MLSWRHAQRWADGPADAVIVAGGPVGWAPGERQALEHARTLVAVDSGADSLARAERTADLLIGDMDSVTQPVLEATTQAGRAIESHDPRKDSTDGELALDAAVARGWRDVVLLGWIGGASRPDHSLANQRILGSPRWRSLSMTVLGAGWEAYVVRDGLVIAGQAGDIVSLLPLTDEAHGVMTGGLEYPLQDARLDGMAARGVSNVMSGAQATVELEGGLLLVMHLSLEGER